MHLLHAVPDRGRRRPASLQSGWHWLDGARAPRFPSPPHLQTLIIAEIECLGFIKRRVVYAENAGRLERRKVSVREHVKLLRLMESGAPADEIEAYARQHKENALHYRHELK